MARRRKRTRRNARRNAGGMPVVLVNPSHGRRRRRRRRRSNPRARRSNPRRRSYRRRRNPTVTFQKSLITFALAGLGGGLGYGIDWGVSHAKVSATWQTVGFLTLGLLGTLGIARWGDERVAAGLAGSTLALGIGRVREAIALSKAAAPAAGAGGTKPAGLEAGAVYTQPYDAGAVMHMHGNPQRLGARAMGPGPAFGQSFKEAAAVYTNPSMYVPGPIRWYGPRSWAYNTEAGVVRRYVSAHSASR